VCDGNPTKTSSATLVDTPLLINSLLQKQQLISYHQCKITSGTWFAELSTAEPSIRWR